MTGKLGSNCTARVGIRKRQGCVSLEVNEDLFCHPLFKSMQPVPLNAILCLLFLGLCYFIKLGIDRNSTKSLKTDQRKNKQEQKIIKTDRL